VHPYVAVHDFSWGPEWTFEQRDMDTYNPLVDIMGHEHFGAKTLLFLVEGLYGADHQSVKTKEAYTRWLSAPFNNDWPSSLFASQDNVAIESVCLDFMRNEPSMTQVYGNVDNYLHEAALADDPPSGTFYDPEGDGTGLSSLGVHEHWDNAEDRQYSRNLGTGEGIELIQNPTQSIQACRVDLITEYASAEGDGIYKKGDEIEISLSPTIVSGGSDIQYVFTGWSGKGEGAYTGSDSAFTIVLNDNIQETAEWKVQYLLSVNTDPFNGGIVDLNPSSNWFDKDAVVSALATAESCYSWSGWTGDTTCTDNPVQIKMDRPKFLTANFEIQSRVKSANYPNRFDLKQNAPNPFNPETVIIYDLPKAGIVSITVFDLMGRRLRTLVRKRMQPGSYRTVWDGRNDTGQMLSSGTYMYIMKSGDFQKRMKALLLK